MGYCEGKSEVGYCEGKRWGIIREGGGVLRGKEGGIVRGRGGHWVL